MPRLHSLAGFGNRLIAHALCSCLLSMPMHAADHGVPTTTTPIKHLVVIFQENRSFDQYFASYPTAENLPFAGWALAFQFELERPRVWVVEHSELAGECSPRWCCSAPAEPCSAWAAGDGRPPT